MSISTRAVLLTPNSLKDKSLGISVSDSPDLGRLGLIDTHLRMTLGELARAVIIAGGGIYYGGHLEPEGITNYLIDEAHRYGTSKRPLKVCLAWSEHINKSATWIGEQKKRIGLAGQIYFLSLDGKPLKEETILNKSSQQELTPAKHAASLTGLRTFMAKNTDARIVIGGKRTGFKGDMPGIVQEVLFSLEHGQQLYLVGGFGGVTLDIIRTLRPTFADWFPQGIDGSRPIPCPTKGLAQLENVASTMKWDGYENGLTIEENRLLAASYRPSEIAALVGKGLASELTK